MQCAETSTCGTSEAVHNAALSGAEPALSAERPFKSTVMAHGELFATEEEAVKRSKEIPLARGVARVEWEE